MAYTSTELQQTRERRGFSLEQLAARTKIRVRYLEAIEHQNLSLLPAGPSGRGFVRAYAHELGINADELVRLYNEVFQPPEPPMPHPPAPAQQPEEARKMPAQVASVGGLVVVATAATLLALLAVRPNFHREPAVAAVPTSAPEPIAAPSAAVVAAAAKPSTPAVLGPADTLKVAVEPTGMVWLQVRADGKRVYYALAGPEDRPTFEAHDELVILVGDAGAVQYTINGVRGRPVGSRGEVRTIRLTRDNFTELQEL